jgi:hypothetical protein
MHRLRTAALLALLGAASCSRHDQQLQDHQDAFGSLSASVHAVVGHWLTGTVSGTYASTALEQLLLMVEQERSALTASPKLLIDRRGAALADSAAQLSREIAVILASVRDADGNTARQHLAVLPFSRAS